MMVDVFKKPGTVHSASEVLKMSVNTGDSWSAQYHSVEGRQRMVQLPCGGSFSSEVC